MISWYHKSKNYSNFLSQSVIWSSQEENIATVDPNTGVVTFHDTEYAHIIATSTQYSYASDYVLLEVIRKVEGVYIDFDGSYKMSVGDVVQLKAEIFPSDATYQDVIWDSSDDTVATVDKNGLLTVNAVGLTVITLTSAKYPEIYDYFTLEAFPAPTSIEITDKPANNTLYVGDTHQLGYTIAPTDALQYVKWSSSNSSVAEIDPDTGRIIAKDDGTTVITLKTTNTQYCQKQFTLTVKRYDDPFHPTNIEYIRIKKYDMSDYDGDSDITTVVTKSYVENCEYFECFAPDRSEVAFKVTEALKNSLENQEQSFQETPNMTLPNFYFHLVKNLLDRLVSDGVIEYQSAEYYGIWASEGNRLLAEVNDISNQIQLACAVVTTAYCICNVVASIRAIYQATNTTQTISNTQYVTYYHQTRNNYLEGGIGYETFAQAKGSLGSAGQNKAWHHIVEQYQIDASGFSATDIHNTKNMISVPSGYTGSIHGKITGHYGTTTYEFTNGLSVRQWLAGKSFQFQFEYGLEQLRQYGTVIASETGWIFIPN